MTFLSIVMASFLLLEVANGCVLFFWPNSKQVHGMGMFPAWAKAQEDPDVRNLMRYLTLWVAGSKWVLSALLLAVLLWGDQQLKILTGFALALSMVPFYFGLFPTMKQIDARQQVDPQGFSWRLAFTITLFIVAFALGATLAAFGVG